MTFEQITLSQLATIHDEADNLQTHIAGSQTIFTGDHQTYGNFAMMQVGPSNEAVLIQL